VDPLDGTREFVAGIPEFCVSVALVESHRPIAGGICNPATGETFIGSLDTGVMYNGKPATPSSRISLDGAVALASRSEIKRGEWKEFSNGPFQIRPVGSVAYKLALVSAGLGDLTFTLCPKNEWDVAAGAALVLSSGGSVETLEGTELRCNNRSPRISGLIACSHSLRPALISFLADRLPSPAFNPHG
jgi:myo-inositol-1(or 4)-monophosphatase